MLAYKVPPVEYLVYCNLFKYLEIIKYCPVDDTDGEQMEETKLMETLHLSSYIKIKAEHETKGDILYIFLISDPTITEKTAEFKKLLNTISEQNSSVIIVSKNGIKANVAKWLSTYDKKVIRSFTEFKFVSFKMDPRNSVMVSKHTVCTDKEVKQIMDDNKIDDLLKFQKILSSDPQVLWAGGRAGDLIRIDRQTVSGPAVVYRYVK
jgi:DNA-directed RNA polymerase subunit H (RpoH/RPB5)